jgi:transaldolase/glucose-6-phosphate isomerase
MLKSMSYSLPDALQADLDSAAAEWITSDKVSRIWSKDASVWTSDDESEWLGWLDIAQRELNDIDKFKELSKEVKEADFSDIVLMGMGGSSLCPEVFAKTFNVENFHILDSTVPEQIRTLGSKLDLSKTLFIVSSKSGSTLEPNCFKEYFYDKMTKAVGEENAGSHFIAVTDPGSKMETIAKRDGFRHIFYGDPEIGGRFSALSAFGLTAAAVMGLDLEKLLKAALEMSEPCRETDPLQNPGALLGLILGICQTHGRDKLTIFASNEIHDLGAWLEQLIAESTGKSDIAIIPVNGEPVQPAVSYGNDRIFVHLVLSGTTEDIEVEKLAHSGQPFIRIELRDRFDLGREFFRWEFATAVAGSVMGIDPFNQPDVESAKIEARKLTDQFEETGSLSEETPFFEGGSFGLYSGSGHAARLLEMVEDKNITEILSAHLECIEEGDYFALLAYIEMNSENGEKLEKIREYVLKFQLSATCLGFGPRFLHSTGQAYKGGPNTGVFMQITADDEVDLDIPGHKYTFGVVKTAQARGDFQVLIDRGRRALHIHIKGDVSAGLDRLIASLP